MRKRNVIVTAVPLAITGVVAAAAYITASDTGVGTATTASTASGVKTTVSVPTTPIEFNDFVTITIKATNTGKKPLTVASVTVPNATIPNTDIAPAGSKPCPAGSFTVDHINRADIGPIAPNTTVDVATARLNFVDLPKGSDDANDQTGCLNARVDVKATVTGS